MMGSTRSWRLGEPNQLAPNDAMHPSSRLPLWCHLRHLRQRRRQQHLHRYCAVWLRRPVWLHRPTNPPRQLLMLLGPHLLRCLQHLLRCLLPWS